MGSTHEIVNLEDGGSGRGIGEEESYSTTVNIIPDVELLATEKYLSVPHRPTKVYNGWKLWLLTYQTLGVIFGDLATSPLYVIPSFDLEDTTNEDFIGIFSVIFWTLTIVPLIKYTCIVPRADDHGEGGTLALYSLLSRHINNLGNQSTSLPSDARRVTVKSKTKAFLQRCDAARWFLSFLVFLATCLMIADAAIVGFNSHAIADHTHTRTINMKIKEREK